MIEPGFINTGSTVKEMSNILKHLEPKGGYEKNLLSPRKRLRKGNPRKRKRDDSNSCVVASSEKFSININTEVLKYCALHSKSNHTSDNCNDLKAMFSERKKKRIFKPRAQRKIDLNALIENNF